MSWTREQVLRLGPDDAGRALEHADFERAEFAPGHRYELVAGRLVVTPAPNRSHADVQDRVLDQLKAYALQHRTVLKRVMTSARVFTRALGASTDVEPDIAAYREWPPGSSWEDVSPVLVVEVVSGSDPDKDLVRNRGIYLRVASIQEYWVVDPRPEAGPALLALARRGDAWVERPVPPGGTYRTDLLPGFTLELGTAPAR